MRLRRCRRPAHLARIQGGPTRSGTGNMGSEQVKRLPCGQLGGPGCACTGVNAPPTPQITVSRVHSLVWVVIGLGRGVEPPRYDNAAARFGSCGGAPGLHVLAARPCQSAGDRGTGYDPWFRTSDDTRPLPHAGTAPKLEHGHRPELTDPRIVKGVRPPGPQRSKTVRPARTVRRTRVSASSSSVQSTGSRSTMHRSAHPPGVTVPMPSQSSVRAASRVHMASAA